jgi:MFS transporter, DHA1 family, inner membrane transport protein
VSVRASLWTLMFGNLAIGTGVMIVAGVLNELSTDLAVPPPVAGQLISVAAIVMALGAPIAAATTSRFDRRKLLALSLAWYAAGLIASALAASFPQLLAIRAATVISAAIFTPQAAATAALISAPETRGRAMAFTFLGWSIASVIGVPIGSWLSGAFGWRTAFVVTGLLAAVGSLAAWLTLPSGLRVERLSLQSWAAVARHPLLSRVLLVTVLSASGQFGVFAFIAPYLLWLIDADATGRALALALIGAAGLLGNILVARRIDSLGPDRSVQITLFAVIVGMALLPAGHHAVLIAALALALWGLGLFGTNSSQQVRLATLAPPLASASIALNTSAIYLGQAIGTAGGGLLYARAGVESLSWFGVAFLVLALVLSMAITRRSKQKGPAQ